MSDDEMDEPHLNVAEIQNLVQFFRRQQRNQTNESLVESLKEGGTLQTERIINAFLQVPRGDFIPPEERLDAYMDSPLPLSKWGFNVSAPHVYVLSLEALNPQEGMSFLDIGSGCGHMAALGSFLVGNEGYSLGLEIREDAVKFARQNVENLNEKRKLNLKCEFETRNCFIPDLADRKFDRIHCGASCPDSLLPDLIALLNPGGILVTPSGFELLKLTKVGESNSDLKKGVLAQVRYGNLILPTQAEILQAKLKKEMLISRSVKSLPSSYAKESPGFNLNPEQIQQMVESGFKLNVHSDLRLILGEEVFFVHRGVIGKRSDHFGALFQSGMKDSKDSEIKIIPGCESSSFCELLRYLYQDEVKLTTENAVDILELASFYQVPRLLTLCECFLKDNVDLENVCDILEAADHHLAEQLKRYCMYYIMDNFDQIQTTEGFQNLSKDLIVAVTSLACSQLRKTIETISKK